MATGPCGQAWLQGVSWALAAHAVPSLCQREVEILMFLSAIVMMKNRRSSESGDMGGWGCLWGLLQGADWGGIWRTRSSPP